MSSETGKLLVVLGVDEFRRFSTNKVKGFSLLVQNKN